MENLAAKAPETNTMELTLMVEDELSRLQRQYRIMESDRTAYLDHVKQNFGKQHRIIANLKTEQSVLLKNLHVANSKHNRRKDEQIMVHLKRLLEEHGSLSEKIRVRKNYIHELDYQIRKIQKDTLEACGEINKEEQSFAARETLAHANLNKLENKLETCNNRFGVVLSRNRYLRQEIDHLLNERQHFNKNWESLFLQLEFSKKFMIDLIEQATMAYGQREEWCQKLEALRMRAFADLQYHSEEMRVLQRTLDHDVALQNFLLVKGQRRIAHSVLKKELMRREEFKMKLKEQTEKYSKTLHDIQEFAGDENVHHLAKQFVKQEEENFALFNYIHELNSELECMSDTIGGIRLKMDEHRFLNNQQNSKQMDNINYLSNTLVAITLQTTKAQKKFIGMNQQLRNIFEDIERLFQKISCEKAPILDLLGQVVNSDRRISMLPRYYEYQSNPNVDHPEVPVGAKIGSKHAVMNVHNVTLYLGVLEARINDVVKNIFLTQGRRNKNNIIDPIKSFYLMTKIESIGTPCPLCYEAMMVSGSDKVTMVMSRKAAKRMVGSQIDENSRFMHHLSKCDMPQAVETMKKRISPNEETNKSTS